MSLRVSFTPHGKREGRNWCVGDTTGERGRSFQICIAGPKAGLAKDFAQGSACSLIDCYASVHGTDFKGALHGCATWLGITADIPFPPLPTRRAVAKSEPAVRAVRFPQLEPPSESDIRALSESRNLSPAGLRIAAERQLLWFHTSDEGRAWSITDSARRIVQSRRLDGNLWTWNQKKAWTHGGSCASWPIGIAEAEPYPAIALVEGAPDFLAAFHHIEASAVESRCAPVCLTGASMSIPEECLCTCSQQNKSGSSFTTTRTDWMQRDAGPVSCATTFRTSTDSHLTS